MTRRTSPFLACEVAVGPCASDTESDPIQGVLTKVKQGSAAYLQLFTVQVQEVTGAVERIRKYTKATEVLHRNALAEARTEERMNLLGEVEGMVGAVLVEVQGVGGVLEELQRHKAGREGAKIRSVGRMFVAATGAFERVQEEYREKYRKQLARQYQLIDPSGNLDLGLLGDSQSSLLLSQQIFKLPDASDARLRLETLREENAEMRQVERGVEEVRVLFADISRRVLEQGDQINTVEDYVLEVCSNAEQAAGALNQTIEIHRQRQARRRAAMTVATVVLALLVGIIANELGVFRVLGWMFAWLMGRAV